MKALDTPKKKRLDQLLVENHLVPSREKARQLIMAGAVYIKGSRVDKPGALILPSEIEIKGKSNPYVSRGGAKLEHALNVFGVSPQNKTVLDAGASTGGFTDCLLQKGAAKVYAVDVGYGQLAWKLQTNIRVVRIERVNVRYLKPEQIGEKVDLVVIDLSFISLTLILEHLLKLLKPHGDMIALIKPQFEVGKGEVGRGGIVKDGELHQKAVRKIEEFSAGLGLQSLGIVESPVLGQKGNKEFLIHLKPTIE